ncbi:L-arabinose transport system permease protein AraQ [Paenibacillus solanacearum]|uniref:L-arabinose transport system permease protein AraQ n=1 Tax=Paenibacillus solanacearum TaxID=2048548 RepID=A0A916NJ64_9BACL|nr:carbohydrate ABC transporter permease [Paenibacillus solanacearum]CAG7629919.1 L-arabinose transport system permease protein AraQ [Paenibacillus solanacearum]
MLETRSDKITEAVNYALLTLISLIVLYPLLFVLVASISNPESVLRGEVWLWPKDITFVGYERILGNPEIMRSYGNTIAYTIVGTAVNLVMTIAAAYPLSRKDFAGRGLFTALIVFTMFFSGGMIPTYLIIKKLGLLGSFWVMIIPSAVSVWNVIIMRTFFTTGIPVEMQEAAAMDGCTNMQLLMRIVLPLSMPVIAVMVLFYSVGHWNAYFNALLYLNDRGMYPLQLILREILVQGQMQEMVDVSDDSLARSMMDAEAIKYAAVIVANLPVLMLYPFLQKYFVKGVMIGAVKG